MDYLHWLRDNCTISRKDPISRHEFAKNKWWADRASVCLLRTYSLCNAESGWRGKPALLGRITHVRLYLLDPLYSRHGVRKVAGTCWRKSGVCIFNLCVDHRVGIQQMILFYQGCLFVQLETRYGWPGGPQEVIAIALKIWKHVSEDNLLDCFNHLWVLAFSVPRLLPSAESIFFSAK